MACEMHDSTREMYFFSNACHVCRVYGSGVNLKRCWNCKMIAYCSREHHKALCRIFTEMLRQTGTVFGVWMMGDFYADYAIQDGFVRPNYIIGFNLGIHECESLDNDTWAPSIEELAKQDCPFFMTSYTVGKSVEERERPNRVLGDRQEFSYFGKNPFSSLRPYRDFETEDFFYPNEYLTIYEKLS